jgi:hypothetical protein
MDVIIKYKMKQFIIIVSMIIKLKFFMKIKIFGDMCMIIHDYLTYNICSFERVIACLLQINSKNN